jgi:hypothetical protein
MVPSYFPKETTIPTNISVVISFALGSRRCREVFPADNVSIYLISNRFFSIVAI